MTFVQKVLARRAGLKHVEVGQTIEVTPDINLAEYDGSLLPGDGGGPLALVERGLILPGKLVVGFDSRTTGCGAAGALAVRLEASEISEWSSGTTTTTTASVRLRIPSSFRFLFHGAMQGPVSARDIALKVLGDVGAHGAAYRSVEFAGNAVEAMSIPDRMVLCDMASETGVRNAYVPPDDKVVEFLRHRAETGFESVYSDPKAEFEKTLEWDVSGLQPQVAADGTMDGVKPVSALEGTPVQRCILGICTNSLQDLRDAARVLKGRKVHPGTRLLIVPASPKVTLDATEDGTLEVLVRAGGVLMNRGGGPCPGGHEWVWAEGEICVSAASRRGPAPTGVSDARVFLTSSATVAASAVEGCIADPRRYWS